MGSEKSPLNSSDSSCASAFLAITKAYISSCPLSVYDEALVPSNACSTLTASFALVSKYGIPPFDWQNAIALFDDIMRLFSSTSILLPSTTYLSISSSFIATLSEHIQKGNFLGREG